MCPVVASVPENAEAFRAIVTLWGNDYVCEVNNGEDLSLTLVTV